MWKDFFGSFFCRKFSKNSIFEKFVFFSRVFNFFRFFDIFDFSRVFDFFRPRKFFDEDIFDENFSSRKFLVIEKKIESTNFRNTFFSKPRKILLPLFLTHITHCTANLCPCREIRSSDLLVVLNRKQSLGHFLCRLY